MQTHGAADDCGKDQLMPQLLKQENITKTLGALIFRCESIIGETPDRVVETVDQGAISSGMVKTTKIGDNALANTALIRRGLNDLTEKNR